MCAIGVYFVLDDVIAKMADVITMRGLLADVTAMWLVSLPLLFVCFSRCYSLVADVIAIVVVSMLILYKNMDKTVLKPSGSGEKTGD